MIESKISQTSRTNDHVRQERAMIAGSAEREIRKGLNFASRDPSDVENLKVLVFVIHHFEEILCFPREAKFVQ